MVVFIFIGISLFFFFFSLISDSPSPRVMSPSEYIDEIVSLNSMLNHKVRMEFMGNPSRKKDGEQPKGQESPELGREILEMFTIS